MNQVKYFNTFCGALGAFFSFFLGSLDGILLILVIVMAVDYITGVLNSFVNHSFSSNVGFHGIARKACMFLVIGIANILDHELLAHSEVLRDAVCMFYLANEGLSVMENAISLGVPFPEKLKERFIIWRNGKLDTKHDSHNLIQ